MLGWQLILFWSTLHFITHVISSYRPQRRDSQQGLGTSWSLKWITLHVETNAFNNLPENVLLPFDPRRRSKSLDDGQRPGALLFDLGAITATMCFLAAQVVLVWATSKSMLAMWRVYSGHADPLLARRDLAASDGLVLRPVVSHSESHRSSSELIPPSPDSWCDFADVGLADHAAGSAGGSDVA